jgi:hypothetical protein
MNRSRSNVAEDAKSSGGQSGGIEIKRMPEKAAEMRVQLDAMLKEHGAEIPDPGYKKK